MKKVLVLGAGLVAGPLVRYLLDDAGFRVTVASRTEKKAQGLVDGHRNGAPLGFDITEDGNLLDLLLEHDLVVSLLPYTHHVHVAEGAIKAGIPMVTTSYVSDAMRELGPKAEDAGIMLLNEMGLDPGIDHMEAQRVIDEVKVNGGEVEGFISYCGGLPAPEANDNPWGYKFSWSPKGVVLASRNPARFRRNGDVIEIPGKELFAGYELIEVPGLPVFEGYPNRDSVPYASVYGIEEAKTVLRGTLRNRGWCDTWKGLHDIGYLEDGPVIGETYLDVMEGLAPGGGPLKERITDRIDTRDDGLVLENWKWLGLLSDLRLLDRTSRLDALSRLLESRLRYSPGERDMIVLQHRFSCRFKGKKEEVFSTMIDYGIPGGDSAMSRTVGIPAAIGSEMILNGNLKGHSGVLIPTLPDIYKLALRKLEGKGIRFESGVSI